MDRKAQQHELTKEYEQRFGNLSDYRGRIWKILCDEFFNQYVSKSDVLLDLGCGWGEFTRNIEAAEKHGMDLNPDAAQRLPPAATFHCQDCSETWPFDDESLDVVFTSNFFEHLPNKNTLRNTLLEARRCLRPHGKLICMGPNIRFLNGSYWDFWDHHIALSDYSLKEALELLDFKVTRCTSRFLPYTMARESQPPVILMRLYLKMQFIWPLFGRQFLVIAEPGR